MARFAYRTLDLPPVGMGAFTPLPTVNPLASSFGEVVRAGAPGTLAIPAPAPTRVWAPRISATPLTQGSNVSPDIRTPDIYVAFADNMHGPFPTRIRNNVPIPAQAIIYNARNAQIGRKVGTRVAMPWPRAFQRWPTSGGTSRGMV